MEKTIQFLFGNRIRQLRNAKNLSQEELANLANMHRTYIGMIERGEKNITLVNIEKLADTFQIPIKSLFNFETKEKS